ncbi:membrane fusion protein, multidrug efflux system [Tardiphaga sp. OK246]|jgi:membrane fusion protein (multidrug efflux system)|uniref:HlyD family secretion protein n=1 Tax=Tardiphaga sp. OK246 TaxID=1855307 RepID=UPI000B64B1DB|nr:HlyD family secretion protein [Tardiphaga sp. OK246]SNS42010.1 membrane fusion protein, multidrug efflux system [Tardiphaga sp. OK246]
MAEPVLKFPDKDAPEGGSDGAATTQRQGVTGFLKRYRRTLLLVVLPAIVLVGGVAFYLSGGRYVGTDDAYVGAQKVLITPDISGKVDKVVVREGQHVKEGDVLFEIDPVPFRLALDDARAKLAQAKTTYDNLVSNVKIYGQMQDLAQQGVDFKQRDVERKSTLVKSNFGSQLDLDNAATAAVTAKAQLELLRQQLATSMNQLLGNPDLPLAQFPPYAQAQSALDQAQRNLDHTVLKAPISGVATQVDNIQLGRFAMAGTPILTVIDDNRPWVDANLKESDFTYIAVGQTVEIDVDAFPNHAFKGTVGSLSPGTGAQFAILPPQNATGNFVKVVQRVPVRVYLDYNDPFVKRLKAGMSTYTTIDTKHHRSLAGLLGLSSAKAAQD